MFGLEEFMMGGESLKDILQQLIDFERRERFLEMLDTFDDVGGSDVKHNEKVKSNKWRLSCIVLR